MRAFICNAIGTGVGQVVALDPADHYTWDEPVAWERIVDPVDGPKWVPTAWETRTVTTALVEDPVRPVVADQISGPYTTIEVDSRGAGTKLFVLARDVTVALAQTYDLGDPTNPDDMNRSLSSSERNALEQLTAQPNGTFDGFTIGDTFLWFLADGWLVSLPGWAGAVPVVDYPPATNPRLP